MRVNKTREKLEKLYNEAVMMGRLRTGSPITHMVDGALALIKSAQHKGKKAPYDWTWEELDEHLAVFDTVEVNHFDGGEHKPFSGDSGVSVLRVTDISPVKRADGKVILHISTDSNFFGKQRCRIMGDDYIDRSIKDLSLDPETEERVLKALGIGVPPPSEPTIGGVTMS